MTTNASDASLITEILSSPDRWSAPVLPMISIVMPSFNQAEFIRESIESVLNQSYANFELIIVDGASTDGAMDIIREYGDRLVLTSEPDNGQAHAINKGFASARGEILCWLNSDDRMIPGTLATVAGLFATDPGMRFLYGDAIAISRSGSYFGRRTNVRSGSRYELINVSDFIVQPASFWRATLWYEIGPLNESYEYVLDYEFFLRAYEATDLRYVPIPFAEERIHSNAKTSNGRLDRVAELREASMRHGGKDVPTRFKAEASAAHFMAGCAGLFDSTTRSGRYFARSIRLLHYPLRSAAYVVYASLFGWSRTATLHLWVNWLRNGFRRVPKAHGAMLREVKP